MNKSSNTSLSFSDPQIQSQSKAVLKNQNCNLIENLSVVDTSSCSGLNYKKVKDYRSFVNSKITMNKKSKNNCSSDLTSTASRVIIVDTHQESTVCNHKGNNEKLNVIMFQNTEEKHNSRRKKAVKKSSNIIPDNDFSVSLPISCRSDDSESASSFIKKLSSSYVNDCKSFNQTEPLLVSSRHVDNSGKKDLMSDYRNISNNLPHSSRTVPSSPVKCNSNSTPSTPKKNKNKSSLPSDGQIGRSSSVTKLDDIIDSQKIVYSQSISSSPGKYFGSPKKKSGSPRSPSKHPNKFSPFRKAHRFKSPQNSSQKVIEQYFCKVPQRKNLFNSSRIDRNIVSDTVELFGINKLDDDSKNIQFEQIGSICNDEESVCKGSINESKSDCGKTSDEVKIKSTESLEACEYSQLLDSEEFDDVLGLAAEKFSEKSSKLVDELCLGEVNLNEVKSDYEKKVMKNIEDTATSELINDKGGGGSSFFYLNALRNAVMTALHYAEIADEEYLFNQFERKILNDFFENLPKTAQYLYCRLLSRKYTWIRKVSMKYPEISPNLDSELDALCENGFITLGKVSIT